MKLRASVALILVSLYTSGCSIFGASQAGSSKQPDTNRASLVQKKELGLEVTWEVPSEPADGFIIRYGDDRSNLSREIKVVSMELHEERDMEYGPVYRYLIRDVSSDKPMYVSIAAFKGEAISDFSDVIEEARKSQAAQ